MSNDIIVSQTAVQRLLELLAESLRQCDGRLAGRGRDFSRTLIQIVDDSVEALEVDEKRDISQDDLAVVRLMVDSLNERYEKG